VRHYRPCALWILVPRERLVQSRSSDRVFLYLPGIPAPSDVKDELASIHPIRSLVGGDFPLQKGKHCCVVSVEPSPKLVYLGNKQAQTREFYIRSANMTRRLDKQQAAYQYTQIHSEHASTETRSRAFLPIVDGLGCNRRQ
jgi:hypothetical protein